MSEWLTLDGVFDASTMAQWFNPFHSDERAAEITRGILASDAFLLGRVTYEMLAPHWSKLTHNEMGVADRLNTAPKYVVSESLTNAPWNNSTVIRRDVAQELSKLKEQPGQNILVMGSATLVDSLMRAGLVDEYRFLIHPVIAGTGKRFFSDTMSTNGLRLTQHKTLSLGVMLLCYEPTATG